MKNTSWGEPVGGWNDNIKVYFKEIECVLNCHKSSGPITLPSNTMCYCRLVYQTNRPTQRYESTCRLQMAHDGPRVENPWSQAQEHTAYRAQT